MKNLLIGTLLAISFFSINSFAVDAEKCIKTSTHSNGYKWVFKNICREIVTLKWCLKNKNCGKNSSYFVYTKTLDAQTTYSDINTTSSKYELIYKACTGKSSFKIVNGIPTCR